MVPGIQGPHGTRYTGSSWYQDGYQGPHGTRTATRVLREATRVSRVLREATRVSRVLQEATRVLQEAIRRLLGSSRRPIWP